MTQAQTLQDIYSKIADIKDVLCAGIDATASEVNTQVLNEISVNPQTWTATALQLENTENSSAITLAQSELNDLVNLTLSIAKSERLPTDSTVTLASGAIVPTPTNSPIALIPKLLKALIQFKAPLSVITKIVSQILSDLLLEHIKRKLSEKNCKISAFTSVGKSKIFVIPENATHLITSISGIPAWVGRDFRDDNLNISLIMPTGLQSLDIAKYSTLHTPEIRFGFRQKDQLLNKFPYWQTPQSIEFIDQYFEIPEMGYSNCERLVYIKSQIDHGLDIAWVIPD